MPDSPPTSRIEPDPNFRTSFYAEISRNKLKSNVLTVFVFLVLVAMVWTIAEIYSPAYAGVMMFFGMFFIILYMGVSYYFGDEIVLLSTNAQPVDLKTPKGKMIDDLVEGICIAARLPKPKVYVIDSPEMNAFATGRDPDHASIAFTTAIIAKLNRVELEGVTSHELSHVANYDVRYGLIVAVMVGLIAILADIFRRSMWFGGNRDGEKKGGFALILILGILLSIFAPILVRIIQASISRKRELLADANGARLTRYPEGLASALEKIGANNKGNMPVNDAVSHLFFVDPTRNMLDDLFDTHPPIEERVKLLRAM